jgi:flagellar motor component MotA
MRELSLQGVVGMIEGSNPKLIRARLEAYLNNAKAPGRGGNQQRMAA